jgi:ribonucrease Y
LPESDAASPLVMVLLAALGVILGAGSGILAGRWGLRRPGAAVLREAERIRQEARLEAEAGRRGMQIAAREAALHRRGELERKWRSAEQALGGRVDALGAREAQLVIGRVELEETRKRLSDRERQARAAEGERDRQVELFRAVRLEGQALLERIGGMRSEATRAALAATEIGAARVEAAHLLRQAGEPQAGAEITRRATQLLGIAAGRFSDHYLTERSQSLVPLGLPRDGHPAVTPGELQAIAAVAGVRLLLGDGGDVVRIEGLDGVGREVARRSLARLLSGASAGGATAVTRAARDVLSELDREVVALGRKAFEILEIEPAHPDILRLVGRLNWRTSFTQNQWKHAVEAGFLCGMLADELGLDRRLARRAALLHDIGKALTHELDGAHAVIGAAHARRLGETEVVANAIGAHHTDEPFASPYAHLVAAADAMSGARPGARRHTEDNFLARVADLERIGRSFPGVAEAFALQGGREVRVLVRDQEVDDLGAVGLSSSIARAITDQLTFPGQIRVTVIRELKSVTRTSG